MFFFNPFFNPYHNFQNTLEYRNFKTLDDLMTLVKDTILKEREHELFLDYLISAAPTLKEKSVIFTIKYNKRKHIKFLKEIYTFYTGESMPSLRNISFETPNSYADGIRKAKFYELSVYKRYRNIRAGIPNKYYRDMMLEILNDKFNHLQTYDYISYHNYNSSFKVHESDSNTANFSAETKVISRQTKEFTLSELENYNGSMGKPAYVAVNGIVYDVSNEATWGGASHFGLIAGRDLSSQFHGCHGTESILAKLPKVGILKK